MALIVERTTQELGVPVTEAQQTKLFLLYDLGIIDLQDWLNPCDYPADIIEAKHKFDERFAFYDMLTLNAESNDNLSLIKIAVLWHDFMDYCACHPSKLLDPKRYSKDLEIAKCQLQERIVFYDLFKAPVLCYGDVGSGKTGWYAAHSWHGKEWFDLPVVTYKFRFNEEAYGDFIYLNEEKLIESVRRVTKLVDQGRYRQPKLEWEGKTEGAKQKTKMEFAEELHLLGSIFVIDEAHKVVAKDHRTLISSFIKDLNPEWRHYKCQIAYITSKPKKLDREDVLENIKIEMGVSRSYDRTGASIINILHRETGDRKPLQEFNRLDYKALWTHDSLIGGRSLITAKDIRRMIKQKETQEQLESD